MARKPGDTLLSGHYRILRLLGRGGFGFVYQARDTLLDRDVAIKELIPGMQGDEAMLKRFLGEARATMELTHRRIVRTYSTFREGGNYYIVMEYMPGGSLEERLREHGPLPVDEAVRVAAEVCEGLACAHEEGVVHCDLKPHNVLFDAQGQAKVADFGIAHVSGEMLTRSWRTRTGSFMGTLAYMSPEQTEGERKDPRIDVYSLGAALYRMLAGQTYLDFDPRETPRSQSENVQRILEEQPLPPSTHNRRVPAWLDRVVLKALAKRPGERYATVADLRAALLQKEGVTAAAPPPEIPQPRAPAKQPEAKPLPVQPKPSALPASFWPMVLGGGALLVALVIGLVALLGGHGPGGATPTATMAAVVQGTDTATPTGTPPATDTPAPPAETPTRTPTPRPPLATATLGPTTATPTDTPVPPTTTLTDTPMLPTATPTDTPTPTRTSAPTGRPTSTSRPPPTWTPTANPTFPAPALVGPADGQAFSASDTVVLQWNPVGLLPADGYYVVGLAYTHNGATWTDDTPWTTQVQWAVSEHAYLLDLSDDGRFRWSVQVMRQTGTDAQGRPSGVALSPASSERTFTWQRDGGGPGPPPPPPTKSPATPTKTPAPP